MSQNLINTPFSISTTISWNFYVIEEGYQLRTASKYLLRMKKLKNILREKRIQRYANAASTFENLKKKEKKWFIENIDSDFVKFLSEACFMFKKGGIPISSKSLKALTHYKTKLNLMASPQSSFRQRKECAQSGGFLSIILSTIASALITHFLSEASKN